MNWNAIRTYILGSGILMVVVPYAINFFTNAIGCMGDNPATEVLELTVCTGGSLLAIPGWMQTTVAVVVLSALGAVKLFTGTGSMKQNLLAPVAPVVPDADSKPGVVTQTQVSSGA